MQKRTEQGQAPALGEGRGWSGTLLLELRPEGVKRQSVQILQGECSRLGSKGAQVDRNLASFRDSQEGGQSSWRRGAEGEGGIGMGSLGANHLGPEGVTRTLAFPLGEVGAPRVLRRSCWTRLGLTQVSQGTPPAGWRGQNGDQRRGGCNSLDEKAGSGRGRGGWVAKKAARTSPIPGLF